MNKYLAIFTAILLIILSFFIYRSCNKGLVKDEQKLALEKAYQDSAKKAIDSVVKVRDAINDSLVNEANIWEERAIFFSRQYDEVKGTEANDLKLVNARELTIQQVLHELDSVKKDTLSTVIDCDRLQADVYRLLSVTDSLENAIDSVNTAHTNLVMAKDSIISIQDSTISNYKKEVIALNNALMGVNNELSLAIAQQGKLIKKAKLGTVLTEIAGIVTGVAATTILTYYLIKK